MVLIISSEDDQSTNDVIDWLRYFKIKYIRISHLDIINYKNLIVNNNEFDVELLINGLSYKLTEFNFFWYRRSFLNLQLKELEINSPVSYELKKHIYNEAQEIHRIVKRYIESRSINKHNDIFINKLEVLKKAAEIGIKIPKTIVTNNKEELIRFLNENKNVITKNISQGVFIKHKNSYLTSSTNVIDDYILNNIPENFHFMLFQEMVEKLFEVRIFFIDNDFYSSAIFSQNNEKTKVDFRNYDFQNPNRTPPFLLPKVIKKNLIKLMKEININSGSIDLIVNTNNEFVFLEVNPIGQFSQVSMPCNYYIEKLIAKKIAIKIKKKSNGSI